MATKFRVLSNPGAEKLLPSVSRPESQLRHFRNVNGSVLQNALDTWAEIWNEFQGTVTHGCLVTPEAERGFKPKCGWPEYLEKMWLLKHYLDYAKRYCEGE